MKAQQVKSKGKWTVHNRTNEAVKSWTDNWWEAPQEIRNIREDNNDVLKADTGNNTQLHKQIKNLVQKAI